MSVSERAKQFSPFSPLKGLSKALAAKEKIRVPKRELSDETIEKINNALVNLKIGEIITVVYYEEKEQEYLQLTGMVAKVNEYENILQIVSTKIRFEDIYDIILADSKGCPIGGRRR